MTESQQDALALLPSSTGGAIAAGFIMPFPWVESLGAPLRQAANRSCGPLENLQYTASLTDAGVAQG